MSRLNKKMLVAPTKELALHLQCKCNDAEMPKVGALELNECVCIDINIKRRENQFNTLVNKFSGEQRTNAWFKERSNKITASDVGTVLGVNKYSKSHEFIIKKCEKVPFNPSIPCHHGNMFERLATMYYEYENDVIVHDFGVIGHDEHKFLGASPDGIVGPKTKNGELSPLVGRMLEIKCPLTRKINKVGEHYGVVCPEYYYHQVLLQMECCNLDETDFLQCKFEVYDNKAEYNVDIPKHKGALIQLIPNDVDFYDFDSILSKAKWIYQPSFVMNEDEIDNWVKDETFRLKSRQNDDYSNINETITGQYIPGYKLHSVKYWRLVTDHTITIHRDTKWFTNVLPLLEKMWSRVSLMRDNPLIYKEWKEYKSNLDRVIDVKMIAEADRLLKKL